MPDLPIDSDRSEEGDSKNHQTSKDDDDLPEILAESNSGILKDSMDLDLP